MSLSKSFLVIHHFVDGLVVELGGLDSAGYRADLEFSRRVIPVGVFQEIIHRVLGTQFRGHATWTPDPECVWTARRPAAGPQAVDVTQYGRYADASEKSCPDIHMGSSRPRDSPWTHCRYRI